MGTRRFLEEFYLRFFFWVFRAFGFGEEEVSIEFGGFRVVAF